MKLNKTYFPILLFSTLALGLLLGNSLNYPSEGDSFSNHKTKLNKLIDFIDDQYVDKVNTDSIVDLAVDNILAKLDPHSVYVPPSQQSQIAESMRGDFVGIGINYYMYKDTVAVIKPTKNGPSEKAGILAGDRILYADNYKLFGRQLPTDSLFPRLKGKIGSEVTLTIFRKSENKKFALKLTRDIVPIESVDVATMLSKTTGFIKINRFAETTYDEFKKGLLKLKQQGASTLIIDLRDNGGGYMERASAIADEFLKDKQLIVFTKNKKGRIDKTFATEEGDFETGKVFVLINENSASASEILAGAIQDNDRGIIVGRRSFGKGLVQHEMDFDDGSAVRLTIARYYTPTGRSIQKPYVKGDDEGYFKEADRRFENGELYQKDSIKTNKKLIYKTPKGKIVYGGGGIVPDVFVPLEAEQGNENVIFLLQSGVMSNFVFEQLDKDRKAFRGMSLEQLFIKINASELYFNNFRKYLIKTGVDLRLENNSSLVNRYIFAEFARQLFGEEQYYKILLKEDVMIKEVLGRR